MIPRLLADIVPRIRTWTLVIPLIYLVMNPIS